MAKQFVLAVVAIGALSAPTQAVSPNIVAQSGSYSIGISGFVPVVCRATVDSSMIGTGVGTVRVGSLSEFCNSPNGYEVHADYSLNLAKAKLIVDGKNITLSDKGSARISRSNRANIQQREIFLNLPENVDGGSVSFRIVPL